MAKFKDMRDFVAIAKAHNDEQEADEMMKSFAEGIEHVLWMKRDEAKSEFATSHKVSDAKAQEVYEDVVSEKRGYVKLFDPNLPHQDKRLRVTSEGRHLLERFGKLPSGMMRAWADDNKSIATLILSFVTGIIIGGVGMIVGR